MRQQSGCHAMRFLVLLDLELDEDLHGGDRLKSWTLHYRRRP